MKSYQVALIKGDGIGPEVINEATKILDRVGEIYDFKIDYKEFLMGGCAYEACQTPLPQETIDGCIAAQAVLFGSIGGPKWDTLPRELRPESGLLKLRSSLEVFANLRPAIAFKELLEASTLKPEVLEGVDLVVVRELVGGIYFGKPRAKERDKAYNTMVYNTDEIKRIAKVGFELAQNRRKKLCSVDKANVLEVSQFWREVVMEVSKNYPDVELTHQYVDNASMQLIKDPKQFDVILTSNLFGDILSDIASMLTGSIGLLPSASMGEKVALYEPIHGSAPDIAGMGIANPIAAILSASMLLKYSFKENSAAKSIEQAVVEVLKKGYRTKDIGMFDAKEICTTNQMGDLILKHLKRSPDEL